MTNYDKEVFNGDIEQIESIDVEESVVKVGYDGRIVEYEFGELDELSLDYATSIQRARVRNAMCVDTACDAALHAAGVEPDLQSCNEG